MWGRGRVKRNMGLVQTCENEPKKGARREERREGQWVTLSLKARSKVIFAGEGTFEYI